MNNNLAQVEFYFPKGTFSNKEGAVDKIVLMIKESGSISYCGYTEEKFLKEGLVSHIGNGDTNLYSPISEQQKSEIRDTILKSFKDCNEKLSVPTKNFVFVHPYFPTNEDVIFEGVMAVATYSCVFHLFVDLNTFTKKALVDTVAHELNHTIFYYHHYNDFNNYTLLDEILMEGLAENFREQYFNPQISPWAGALDRETALKLINDSRDILFTRNQDTIRNFLFGDKTYKKWSGYSCGYWLVNEFLKKRDEKDWNKIMKIESKMFLDVVNI